MPVTLESIQATCEARTISQTREIAELGDRMTTMENTVAAVRLESQTAVAALRLEVSVQVAVIKTQVGMYAAGGAILGGGIVGLIITAVERFIFSP